MKKHDKRTSILGCTCPECWVKAKNRRHDPDEESAMVICEYDSAWIYSLTIDCHQTADHVVTLNGAWTNPIIQTTLESLGLSKKAFDKFWRKNIESHIVQTTNVTDEDIRA